MLGGFVSGLIIAWILSLFGIDHMLIDVVQPFVTITLTTNHYYIFFALIGMLGGIFNRS